MWDTMKSPKLRIGIKEGKDVQIKSTENIFNIIIEEKFPDLKKNMHMWMDTRSLENTKETGSKKSSRHIIIKTLNLQNKERILRAAKKKAQVTCKGRPIRITTDFSMETMKVRRS